MMISGLHRPRLLRGAALDAPVVAPVIRTPRLVLRPHRMDDADAWLAIEADPSIRRNLHWPERDQHHALAHLRDRTRHTMLLQSGDFLALAVELDGEVIGDVSVHLRTVAPETRSAELGWLELSRYGGRGYATEAAEGMLGFVFGTLGARWVTAVIDDGQHPLDRPGEAPGLRVRSPHRHHPDLPEAHPSRRSRPVPCLPLIPLIPRRPDLKCVELPVVVARREGGTTTTGNSRLTSMGAIRVGVRVYARGVSRSKR